MVGLFLMAVPVLGAIMVTAGGLGTLLFLMKYAIDWSYDHDLT